MDARVKLLSRAESAIKVSLSDRAVVSSAEDACERGDVACRFH